MVVGNDSTLYCKERGSLENKGAELGLKNGSLNLSRVLEKWEKKKEKIN